MNIPLLLGKTASYVHPQLEKQPSVLVSPESNRFEKQLQASDAKGSQALLKIGGMNPYRDFLSARLLALVVTFLMSFSTAWSQEVDLSLSKKIDKSRPAIGEVVTYSITVKNTSLIPATGVVVKDSLPIGGVTYLGNVLVRGGVSYTVASGLWNVGTVAPGDSAILNITARVAAQGVFFNVAEIQSVNEDDIDSFPGDGKLDQDDITTTCFSVPLDWYAGDEFTVSVPSGYKGIRWFYNGNFINGTVTQGGLTVAVVNADSTLTITRPGSFTFTSTVGIACPASGCCAIEIVQGSIFDLALNKSLAPGQASSVLPGALVKYRLTVTNQGSLAATQIALSDSLPSGLTLADAAWTASGNIATLNTPLAGPLAPGATVFVDITVKVNDNFTGSALINYAQIKVAKGPNGETITDIDSTPDNGFNNGEDDRDNETITISTCPTIALSTPPDRLICVGESVTLSVTSSVNGTTINWYTVATGGSPFVTTASGVGFTLSPTQTTTYYVEGVLANGCNSPRKPITVTVNAKPTTPVASGTIQNVCPATTADLTTISLAAVSTTGGVFEWHVGPSPTSALVVDPTKAVAGTYYIFEKSVAGCYSNALAVVANIIPCDCQLVYDIAAGADQELCSGQPISVTATISGAVTGVTWSTSGTGTFANTASLNTTYLPSAADIAAGVVTLRVTTNDPDVGGACVPKMDALSIVINPRPAPAFGVACSDTLLCLGKSTKLIGFAPGSTIKWYTTATGGTAIGSTPSGGKLVVTPSSTTTYYAEAIGEKGCVSNVRTPVTVVVQPCFSDLAVVKTILSPGPYSPGQEINYSIAVTNLGIGNATSVTVSDVLPASLLYVNSVPAGEYNPATGVWTIGSLSNSSNRVLVITARIKNTASGNIVNTAIVKSPDNNPGRTDNDTSSVTIRVNNIADLMLVKKVSKVNPVIGEIITYTLEVSNSGPQRATNVEVTDPLPAGLEFVSSTDFSKIGNVLTGAIASIEVGAKKTLTFQARVVNGTSIKNIAQISKSDQEDPESTPGNGYDNGEDDESSIIVNVGCPAIDPPLIACAETNICAGTSVTLTATGCTDGTIKWSNGMEGASIVFTLTETTIFTAQCAKGECRSASSLPIVIKVSAPVKPVLVSNVSSICVGGNATLTASNCNGVLVWSTGATGTPLVVKPSVTTTYTAYCEKNACRSEIASIIIEVGQPDPAPIVTLSKTNICPGESVVLTASECIGIIKWSNGRTGASITVSPMSITTYSAKCVVGTCESAESVKHIITVTKPAAPVIASNKPTVCSGGSAILTATNCEGTVRWSNGQAGRSISVSLTASRSFTAICKTDVCDSEESNVVTINVTQPTTPIIASDRTVICSGDSVRLTATGCAGTVNWSNGRTGASIYASPMATTNYTATCKIEECSSGVSNTVTINVNTSGTAPVIAANKTDICAGEEVTLTATGCIGTIRWSNGAEGASIKINPSLTATYVASCKTPSGTCASGSSNQITIEVAPVTPPILAADRLAICGGEEVTMSASNCTGVIKWSNGMQGASINVKPTSTTTYTAVCEKNACTSASATITISVTTTPPPAICAKDSICKGESLTLSIKNCQGIAKWSTGQTAQAIVVTPSATTTYTVRCVVNGCESAPSQDYKITVIELVKPVLVASKNPIKVGESTTITASGCNGGRVEWSNAAAGTSITVSPSSTATYTAICIVKDCVSDTAKITINVAADIVKTDLEIVKTVDKTRVQKGGQVTYSIKLKNNGPVKATNITIVDILPQGIKYIAGEGYSIEGNVITGVIPALAAYDSLIFSCIVDVIGEGTIKNVVRIDKFDQTDSNLANNVSEVDIVATSTAQPLANSIGVAKLAGTPVRISCGVYDVPYIIVVKNLGASDLTQVQVVDDLSLAFGSGAVIVPGSIAVTADAGFAVNALYTGTGVNTGLLVPAQSNLPKGATRNIRLTIRVDVKCATINRFNNVAIGSALGAANVVVTDVSTVGNNPDPNDDLDPTNDNNPTPIVLNSLPGEGNIGVALSVKDTLRQSDGSYDITYMAILKNYGSAALTNVQVTDSLFRVFNTQTGATYRKVGTPTAGYISELAVNPDFDGINDVELLLSSNSRLNAGAIDTLTYTINVSTDGRETPYMNWIYASAKAGETIVTDRSTNGLQPDLNGNNDPTDASESELTPIIIPGGTQVFIPEGFSPNGDGINDFFVIRNVGGQRVILEIYNRWMTLVYKNEDYRNDWDGATNNGLRVGTTSQGLPDGTYFYVVKLENGKQFVRYLTITR